ncbi:hypothetical protein [Cohnella sp.]|uniref:hypothetical protein n=1 Tax=Cohnella sp. TaxID=1883426 RepID=UPI00356A2E80
MSVLIKRLLNLALGELAASVSFVVVYHLYADWGGSSQLALYFLVFQLLQGAAYWIYRARTIGREPSPVARGILTLMRRGNLISAVIAVPWIVTLAESRTDMAAGFLIYAFAVIEYVNYYWYRLSYGKSGFNMAMLLRAGLRPSSIHKLLQRG